MNSINVKLEKYLSMVTNLCIIGAIIFGVGFVVANNGYGVKADDSALTEEYVVAKVLNATTFEGENRYVLSGRLMPIYELSREAVDELTEEYQIVVTDSEKLQTGSVVLEGKTLIIHVSATDGEVLNGVVEVLRQ